jgi:serine/threonine-protein kinase HipA
MAGEVDVYVDFGGLDVLAGRLWMHRTRGRGSATFAYDAAYIGRAGAYELDPELPLVTGSLQTPLGRALFGAFADTGPDSWGRRLINRAEAAAAREQQRAQRAMSERDYLLGVRDDLRQGALRYREPGGTRFLAPEDTGVPPVVELAALLNAADALERDTATSRQLRLLLRGGSSLGGARPKAHVLDRQGRPAIAKFPSTTTDEWDVNGWESVAMALAKRAGTTVADHELHLVDTKSVLVVDRFDRAPDGTRIGYISAMTLLSGTDGQQFDYTDLAGQIEQVSEAPTRDLQELWARCAYGRLISNTDDHLRNTGFLRGAAGWNLSPAFDLNPNPYPSTYATAFAGDDEGSLAALVENADLFRMTAKQAVATLGRIAAATRGWRQEAARLGLPDTAVEAMAPAFEDTQAQRDANAILDG